MYSRQLASCVALALVLLANSAPTSSPAKEAQQYLEQLLLDLQQLLRGINNYKNPKLPMLLTFKFYMPRKATELKHLQCLEEELGPLHDVLNLVQSKNLYLEDAGNFISNIRVTVMKLKGSENTLNCEFDDETVTVVEFLSRWITFCQSAISTMTQ
ncbi:interleukin-2 [Meriones unguiculatus]|uniref:Interleukin-2 n=1 Tax=Meriones unguiculatus TaxID=10047 RepID=IL2_MERUN|nr:interleukin-2 [Meriones unguiculatus]Q08081.1 RecName: Full=Interleukin-2; Short=IL-2; AltName: Full=T-cell growth factor; Short=TCGF; Flags: Precursor [Meriones unguiculatus]CAA48679.1 interleukin 2 [Meriones unguiculatus]